MFVDRYPCIISNNIQIGSQRRIRSPGYPTVMLVGIVGHSPVYYFLMKKTTKVFEVEESWVYWLMEMEFWMAKLSSVPSRLLTRLVVQLVKQAALLLLDSPILRGCWGCSRRVELLPLTHPVLIWQIPSCLLRWLPVRSFCRPAGKSVCNMICWKQWKFTFLVLWKRITHFMVALLPLLSRLSSVKN